MRTIDGFFPAGSPVPCGLYLKGLTTLLQADWAAITLVRLEARRKALVAFDSLTYNLDSDAHSRHRQNLTNERAWEGDPMAHRLLHRTLRRPRASYTYSGIGWVRRFGWQNSFAARVFEAIGQQSGITAFRPIAPRTFAILTVARYQEREFTRLDRRVLMCSAETFYKRVMELRGRSLRDGLPKSLRVTFDLILSGVTEKEIAHATRRNVNTVHDQVKRLYSHFGVSSRPQLMAKFIDPEKISSMSI